MGLIRAFTVLLLLLAPLGLRAANRVGDANNDHTQDMADAALVQARLYGLVTPAAVSPLALADNDNTLDLGDLLYVAQIASGARTSVAPRPNLITITPPPSAIYPSQITPNPVLTFSVASNYPAATNVDGMDALGWSIGPTLSSIANYSTAVVSNSASTDLVAFNPSPSPETFSVTLTIDVADSDGALDHQATANQFFTVNPPACGDGVINAGESCDDGNATECGLCNATCTGASPADFCGDGIVCELEACDDGALNGLGGLCNTTCTATCAVGAQHAYSARYGNKFSQTGADTVVDGAGNVWLTGSFQGTVNFGGGNLTSTGNSDIFLAKFAPNGSHLFSARFGAGSGTSVTVDGAGNVWLTGQFQGTVNFGGGNLTSAGNTDIFLAKFALSGAHLYSARFGDTSDQYGESVAVDSAGSAWLTGILQGTVNFGGGHLNSAGSTDMFLAKFAPSGAHLYSARFGDGYTQQGTAVAVDGGGNVWLTGYFEGTVNFGGGNLTNTGSFDIFLAKFAPSGTHLYSARFGDGDPGHSQYGTSVAVDGWDNAWLTGSLGGPVNFGGGNLVSAGLDDIFLAKFAPNGTHLYSARFGDGNYQNGISVSVDGVGNAWLTGSFMGAVNFGGGTLTNYPVGYRDISLAKFASGGSHLYSASFGDSNDQVGQSITVDGSGNAWLAGSCMGTVNFGGGNLFSLGSTDICLAKFGPVAAPGCYLCGNGALEGPESCDDGNIMPGDGCNSTCTGP